ncbi:hypothetical protein [Paraferrimonas sp. SM1919]|nr:hypothetical protein [Paraferrimonas sp. SM1919]
MKVIIVGYTKDGVPIKKAVESFWDKYVFTTYTYAAAIITLTILGLLSL